MHVPALRAAGFDVRAIVGRNAERTARRADRAGIEHACTTLAEALAVPGVDAVTIVAPPAQHAELSLEAIAAGRHVICEKPFALDLALGPRGARGRAPCGHRARPRARVAVVPRAGGGGQRDPRRSHR